MGGATLHPASGPTRAGRSFPRKEVRVTEQQQPGGGGGFEQEIEQDVEQDVERDMPGGQQPPQPQQP